MLVFITLSCKSFFFTFTQTILVTHLHQLLIKKEISKGDLQGDSQKDKLTTSMMLLARESLKSSPHLPIIVFILHQIREIKAVSQDGRVDIQTKNAGYGGNGIRNAGRKNRNQAFNAGNGNDESNQIV
ncbi:hypothetical protein Tco_1509220 [Tanacetum coccineum]